MISPSIINTIGSIVELTFTVINKNSPSTDVETVITVPSDFVLTGIPLISKGTFSGNTWTIVPPGTYLASNEQVTFRGYYRLQAATSGFDHTYTFTTVVTGVGDTDTATHTVTYANVTCDPVGSGSNVNFGSLCVNISEQAGITLCNQGTTEFRLVPESIVNGTLNGVWDITTGSGCFTSHNPTLPTTGTWQMFCVNGLDSYQIGCDYTFTLYPSLLNVNPFNHKVNYVNGSTLTDLEVATLQSIPAYNSLTSEQIRSFCWQNIYNAANTLVGGWASDCDGEQDNRSFIYCSDEACVAPPVEPCPSCPGGSMPTNVVDYINSILNYTPTKGDNITVYHTVHGGISTYEYSGTQWVRSSCGCIVFVSEDDGNLISTGTDGGAFLAEEDLPAFIANPTITDITFTKSAFVAGASTVTCTVTFSSGPPIIRTFTDIDTNTTYNFNIVDDNLIITPSNGPTQSLSLPTGTGGDNWGSQVVQRTAVFTGNGVTGMPLDLADGGITNVKIADGTITLTKLNQNGAILGQDITWNGTNWAPATPVLEIGANVGSSGSRVYKDKTSNTLNFRRLVAGTNMSITEGTDTITFDSTTSPCICYVDATYNSTSGEFYLHQAGSCDGVTDITWQTANPFAVTPAFADVQTGGAVFSLLCGGTEIAVRVKYAQNGCTRYSQIIQVIPPNC